MSKITLRARTFDSEKPMPVFRWVDLPDEYKNATVKRAVLPMPTGMEKEEESEHHFQQVISAQKVSGEKQAIPVPEGEENILYYESLYPGEFKMPNKFVHELPFSLDAELPDYDMDSKDEMFLKKLNEKMEVSALQFEGMMDQLEKGSTLQPVSLQEAKLLLKEDDELITEMFAYWSRKRATCVSGSLTPIIKQDNRDSSSTNDPYVVFRSRVPTMNYRKNDEASYKRMLTLRKDLGKDLGKAVSIMEMMRTREKSKTGLLHTKLEVIEKRNLLPDFGAEVMAEGLAQGALAKPVHTTPPVPLPNSNQDHLEMELGSSSDEEPFSQVHSGSSEEEEKEEEDDNPDGDYAFRRKAGCQYYAPRPNIAFPWESPSEGGLGDPRFRYCLTSLNTPQPFVGLVRRRMGRGGRIVFDRAYMGPDSCQIVDLDPEPEVPNSPPPSSPIDI